MIQIPNGRIIVSVACYCNDEEVLEFARQLENQECSDKLIFLVTANKANNYKSLSEKLGKLNIESYLYNAEKNLGYLNGCLFGVKKYSQMQREDKIIISNTDIVFEDADILRRILVDMKDETIWCLAPSIQLKTGKYQNPFLKERPSKNKVYLWLLLQKNSLLLRFYTFVSGIKNRNTMTHPIPEDSGVIYAGHGSFFALNRNCVYELLKVSENIFMYGEELLVAEIIKSSGGLVKYNSNLHIIHNENSTTGFANAKIKAGWYKKSLGYIYAHYFR